MNLLYTIDSLKDVDIDSILKIHTDNRLSSWQKSDYYNEIRRVDSLCYAAKREGEVAGFIIARLIKSPN